MAKSLLTNNFSERLNGATSAKIDINASEGNLTIDKLAFDEEQVLVSGSLEYFEKQGLPVRNLALNNGQVAFTLKGSPTGRPWLHLPWATCNGATLWQVRLNPNIPTDITAHSGGGNLKLDLTGMTVTGLSADTGGGNLDLVLPDRAADLHIAARSGAGNVVVSISPDIAARIHATTGLGKTILDPRFIKTDKDTYQSSGFDLTAHKFDITLHSGAGNVIVNTL
jgi:hypothetical protein